MYSLNDLQAIVEKSFGELQLPIEPRNLYEPISYTLSLGGKRVRPILCLMSANLFSDIVDKAVKPAIALEIFHNFTLIHDDIMDNADVRRGKPTVHKKWNPNVAILSGDAAIIVAYKYVAQTDPALLPEILKVFNATALEVCDGQQFDMEYEKLPVVTEDDYLRMIELKTSVLLAAAAKIGAILGGASLQDGERLYNFGRNLGLAFQLQDDLLDTYGDPKVFGKAIGGDIISNKKTFLMINALKLATQPSQVALQKILKNEAIAPEEKIASVKAIYDEVGVKEITEKKIDFYYKLALAEIAKISVREERKEAILSYAEKIMGRKS
ncbi:polyprenyl synthetase family protein [Alistipes sp. ZOR0009]|uniref:polyprenyl synthetase family protein n=1 Tax=Alistipes sp. ZOR0009 TaxID=1339253 RepID=UPI000646041C|nr:polyprenyl synthetase family protein [Alistipes sp. ZOR0009]